MLGLLLKDIYNVRKQAILVSCHDCPVLRTVNHIEERRLFFYDRNIGYDFNATDCNCL